MIGFSVSVSVIFYGTTALLGVDRRFMGQGGWGFKEIVVLGISLMGGLFFGLLGFGLGASVNVRSESRNHVLAVLWHYLANGSIIWFMLLGLLLTKVVGQEGVKELFGRLGELYSTCAVAGTGAAGSLAIAAVLIVTGQLRYESKPKFVPSLALSLPLSFAMAYVQFRLLGVSTGYWMIPGVVFPLAVIPVSAAMIARDAQQRRVVLSRHEE